MKRKKWTEEEEAALIREYSELAGSGALARLKTRERKFQPIADRVNALHHLRDPVSFPFRWSWRDVSIKIQNMRHQYLGVKQKIRLPLPLPSSSSASTSGCCFDWSSGEHHWPNFLRYKQVFGDMDLDCVPPTSVVGAVKANPEAGGEGGEEEGEEDEDDVYDDVVMEGFVDEEGEVAGSCVRHPGAGEAKSGSRFGGGGDGRVGLSAAKSLVELGQTSLNREEKRRERDRKREEDREVAAQCKREREHQREMDETAAMHERRWRWSEEQKDWWRRREQRWEEEEMEWRERVLGMQMEHEKHVMQMHLDACQAQTQMLGFLVRLVSQFLGSAGGGDAGLGGLSHQVLHNLQQQQQQHHRQQDPAGMGGDNGKSDASSAGHYM